MTYTVIVTTAGDWARHSVTVEATNPASAVIRALNMPYVLSAWIPNSAR